MIEAKSRAGSSHEKITTVKGKMMVNFLKREFQLIGMVRILFDQKLDYSSIIDFNISYK